jgi:hypothetical protein
MTLWMEPTCAKRTIGLIRSGYVGTHGAETKTLRDSAIFNPEVQVAPSCILWPDKDRQWEAVIPRLQSELAELLVLGDYAPENRTGPAIWLRCVIAGKAPMSLCPPTACRCSTCLA